MQPVRTPNSLPPKTSTTRRPRASNGNWWEQTPITRAAYGSLARKLSRPSSNSTPWFPTPTCNTTRFTGRVYRPWKTCCATTCFLTIRAWPHWPRRRSSPILSRFCIAVLPSAARPPIRTLAPDRALQQRTKSTMLSPPILSCALSLGSWLPPRRSSPSSTLWQDPEKTL